MQTASYAEIQRVLADERSITDAAEAHGTLAGSLCTALGLSLRGLAAGNPARGPRPPGISAGALRELYFRHLGDARRGRGWNSSPCCPKTSSRIDERTAALAQWCHRLSLRAGLERDPGCCEASRRSRRGRARLHRDHARRRRWRRQRRAERERLRGAGRVRACRCAARVRRARPACARRRRPRRRSPCIEITPTPSHPRMRARRRARAAPHPSRSARRVRAPPRAAHEADGQGLHRRLPAAPVRHRNNDVEYAYRQDSDFFYLTGFGEPESVAVLIPGREQARIPAVRARSRPRARDLGRPPRRPRGRDARLRRRRCVSHRRYGRDPARAAREPHARSTTRWARMPSSTSACVGWVNGLRAQSQRGPAFAAGVRRARSRAARHAAVQVRAASST